MDEQRLAELFRDAVGEPPPASFGSDEVVAASQRVTARRRHSLLGGTLLGAAVLLAGVVTGGEVLSGETSTAGQSAPQAGAPSFPRPLDAPGSGSTPDPATEAAPSPRAGTTQAEPVRCAPPDGVLVAELTAALARRGTAASGPAPEVPGPCPVGSRAAAVPVPGGTLYVLVVPQAGGLGQPGASPPDGRREQVLALDGGRVLVVISVPAAPGQPAPLAGDLPALAQDLAARV
ncbi:MAG TPA: hypothetical protein VFQ77_05925 [Pseudonocardiaceae bacterium]|nr:hypothetical protein [Pseudonocardiaceae bacterium]